MIYFKNASGEVFAYETQGERDQYGADDLVPMTAAEVEEHLNPPAQFQQALAELNAAYQADVDKFAKAFLTAYLADGSEQETKQLAIRSQYFDRKAQYTADVQALRQQHEVGV